MPFYSQTLEDIPKEFLLNQKCYGKKPLPEPRAPRKAEDLLFILAVLIFLYDGMNTLELD